jgi:hypothetical protein
MSSRPKNKSQAALWGRADELHRMLADPTLAPTELVATRQEFLRCARRLAAGNSNYWRSGIEAPNA